MVLPKKAFAIVLIKNIMKEFDLKQEDIFCFTEKEKVNDMYIPPIYSSSLGFKPLARGERNQ